MTASVLRKKSMARWSLLRSYLRQEFLRVFQLSQQALNASTYCDSCAAITHCIRRICGLLNLLLCCNRMGSSQNFARLLPCSTAEYCWHVSWLGAHRIAKKFSDGSVDALCV